MKIGYVLDKFPKTSETFIYNEVEGLSNKHDISVFSIDKSPDEIPDKVDIIYSDDLYKEGAKAFSSFIRGDLIQRSVVEAYHHMVANQFKKESDDLEMLHRHFPTNSVIYYLSKELDIPYTLTTHARDIFSKVRYDHLKEILDEAERIITISDYNKNYMIDEFSLQPSKIDVVHMGIDTKKFSPSPPNGNITNILTVARLVEKKGIRYGIEAFSRLSEKYPELHYNIIGEGPMKDDLKNLIEDLDIKNKISLLGRVLEKRLLEEYKKADIFMLPCVIAKDGDRDGIPMVLMESMAKEKLVISTEVSGIPELIDDGENGIMVEPKSPGDLARKIEMVIEGEVDIKSMCKNARKKVCKDFNLDDQLTEMDEIFQDVTSTE